MQDITIKRVYDKDGSFELLELLQGNNVITIKLNNGLDTVRSWHWQGLKEAIENHLDSIAREAIK